MRAATVVRLVVGGLLVVAPRRLLAAMRAPDRDESPVLVVARVLGARLVLQATVDVATRGRSRRVGAAVEAAHAVSMVPVAAWSSRHRRSAGASASLATGLAVVDLGAHAATRQARARGWTVSR